MFCFNVVYIRAQFEGNPELDFLVSIQTCFINYTFKCQTVVGLFRAFAANIPTNSKPFNPFLVSSFQAVFFKDESWIIRELCHGKHTQQLLDREESNPVFHILFFVSYLNRKSQQPRR